MPLTERCTLSRKAAVTGAASNDQQRKADQHVRKISC